MCRVQMVAAQFYFPWLNFPEKSARDPPFSAFLLVVVHYLPHGREVAFPSTVSPPPANLPRN